MKTFEVRVLPDNLTLPVEAGTNLLDALRHAGLQPDAPCGGNGTCGKCKVIVDGQEMLACKTAVDRDMTVCLPESAKAEILTQGITALQERYTECE